MTGKTLQLVDVLLHGEILHAPALAFKRAGFYADLVLITTGGDIRIIGEGIDLTNGEETFFLNLEEHTQETHWHDKQGRPAWPPQSNDPGKWNAVDLVEEIKRYGLESILEDGRRIRFYRNSNTSEIGRKGLLQSAAAVSLTGNNGELVIYATPEFPCSLEVTMEPVRIAAILIHLTEFFLIGG